MKVLIVLALALAAVAIAVQGEKIKIKGRANNDPAILIYRFVEVEADTEETVQAVAFRICEKLNDRPAKRVDARHVDMIWPNIAMHDKVGNAYTGVKPRGLRNGDRIVVWCFE